MCRWNYMILVILRSVRRILWMPVWDISLKQSKLVRWVRCIVRNVIWSKFLPLQFMQIYRCFVKWRMPLFHWKLLWWYISSLRVVWSYLSDMRLHCQQMYDLPSICWDCERQMWMCRWIFWKSRLKRLLLRGIMWSVATRWWLVKSTVQYLRVLLW